MWFLMGITLSPVVFAAFDILLLCFRQSVLNDSNRIAHREVMPSCFVLLRFLMFARSSRNDGTYRPARTDSSVYDQYAVL